jgi:hypothetical protein
MYLSSYFDFLLEIGKNYISYDTFAFLHQKEQPCFVLI